VQLAFAREDAKERNGTPKAGRNGPTVAQMLMLPPRDDWTPSPSAAREGKLDVVKLLLRRGANLNAKEGGGHTAVFRARRYRRRDVEQALIAADGRDK
jgi:hypothetical protein